MQLDQKALEAACEAYDAVASSNPRVAYAVSVGMKRAIRAYLQAVQPVPVVADELVKRIGEIIYGRHERGFILWPLVNGERIRSELTAALTATASAEPVAWQPIETAPKDGTPVLLHWGRGFHPMSGHCEGEMWGHLGFDWSFIPYPTQPKFWISFDLLPAAPVSGGDNAK